MEPVIIESLVSLKEYIPRLKKGAENIANLLQSGDQLKAMQQLPLMFEGIQWVIAAINGIEKNGYSLGIDTKIFNEHLSEIESAIRNQDFVLLADLLEYEIMPIFDEWLNQIIVFAE